MSLNINEELLDIENVKKNVIRNIERINSREAVNKKSNYSGFIDWEVKKNSEIKYVNFDDSYLYNNKDVHEYVYYKSFYDNEKSFLKMKKGKCSISFNAEATLDLQLHILLYDKEEIKENICINPNCTKIVELDEDTNIRVCIRVKGIGMFKINSILIDNLSLWNNSSTVYEMKKYLKNEDSKKLSNDFKFTVNNEGLYTNEESTIILSTLQGKQYRYIKVRDDNYSDIVDKYFKISLNSMSEDNVEVSVICLLHSKKNKEVVQVKNNHSSFIKITKDIDIVETYIRIIGSGYFTIPKINIEEFDYTPTNVINLNIDKAKWYTGHFNGINLSNMNEALEGKISIESGINKYVSYMEANNNFSMLPKNILSKVHDDKVYRFKVNLNQDDGVAVYPMLVFYSDNEKLQVNQLSVNEVVEIIPPKSAKYFRIALRMSGNGYFKLNSITIEEYEPINLESNINWSGISELNILGLSNKKKIKDINMAVIMDEFTTACYEDECNLIKVSPNNWKVELIENKPDLLFVESAWKGNGGKWFKKVGDYGEENNKELFALINYCKANNIPTVFWNKEDPVHFNRFINTAKLFDVIFTTDENSVPNYNNETGKKNAYALPFAAQPKKHNPIKYTNKRINKACFAGSYYKLHEERRIDMEMILDEVTEYGLDIYDRNYEEVMKGNMPNHTFPERFKNNIKGCLKYYEIDKAYKGYKLMVNLNTVKHSPTMFSRRVFEGLACGTPVISNYSQGVKKMFGDIVYIVEENGQLNDIIPKLLEDESYYEKVSMKGMREVFSKHTYEDRLSFILDKVNIPYNKQSSKITLLAIASSKEEFFNILDIYNKQMYENKEIIVLLDKFEGYLDIFDKYNRDGVFTYILSYMHNYNNITELVNSDYVSFIDCNNYYGSNYISDLMMCTKYSDAEVIGKCARYIYDNNKVKLVNKDKSFQYVSDMNSTACICKTTLFKLDSFIDIINNYKNINFMKYVATGSRIFSADKFNYLEAKAKLNKSVMKKYEREINY